ncbi:MAG: alpha/beta hydrolase [Myxococcota bacterium]
MIRRVVVLLPALKSHHRDRKPEHRAMKSFFAAIIALAFGCARASTHENNRATLEASTRPASETSTVFTAESGETVTAFAGSYEVPENRSAADSRVLMLHYVRFPSTATRRGPPIVYLAGGPGGSGIETAQGRRFPLFMAMREFGDVIALDQRGTGASNDLPECVSPFVPDDGVAMSDAEFIAMHQEALRWCLEFWRRQDFDLRGYTTHESVDDLEALRVHLEAEKLSLWGTSYGSHLSLAALKKMGDRIERAVLSSVEGLDQTIKRPARTDDYFRRLQHAIDTNKGVHKTYPDIVPMIRRVHARLDEKPLRVSVPRSDGDAIPIVVQSRTLRLYASALISDPDRAMHLLAVYEGLDRGDPSAAVALFERWPHFNQAISMPPMSVIMDISSGITAKRRAQIEAEIEHALLRSFLNFTIHFFDVAPGADLGDDFRAKPVSDVPTLVLSGTLDGRTYIESQLEATSELSGRQAVTVKNAGHNLFMSSPEVTATIQAFMRGEDVDGRVIDVPLLFDKP